MKNFVLLLAILLLFTLSTISSYEATPTIKSFTVDLIHYDSPLSPMYNSSMTQSELLLNAAFRSISRYNYSYTNNNNSATNNLGYGSKVQTTVTPINGDYLMKIYLGNPPVERLAVADTGAEFSWIQCLPCDQCYGQVDPIFDPKNSNTYLSPDCSSIFCDWLGTGACGDSRKCKYIQSYGDHYSRSIGELASDDLRFDPAGTNYKDFIFGCGHYNVGTFSSATSGIIGLGRGHLSLMSQLGVYIGNKFSYCLNPLYYSGSPPVSKLKFGSDATISPSRRITVPLPILDPDTTHYNLNFEGMIVGTTKILIQNVPNIVVDSGTTLTLLQRNIYNDVRATIISYTGLHPVLEPPNNYNLCFEQGRGDFPFPSITFLFGGSEGGLVMQTSNMFASLDNLVCLLIIPHSQFNILGNMAQVNFEVQYDLDERLISFAPKDCSQA